MGDGIYTALTGAIAQEHSLDVLANNVANSTTTGFRGDRVVFGQLLAGAQKQENVDPRQRPPPVTDKFVRVEEHALDSRPGPLESTGNVLDFALNGEGFFVIRTPNGDRLTRAGRFMLKDLGDLNTMLTTVDGSPVLDENADPIVFPRGTKEIVVNNDGFVRADNVEIAQLAVRRVLNPVEDLVREGTTTYAPAEGAQLVRPIDIDVRQAHLEASNINAMAGLNELITVNRSFDALQRVIQTFQQMDQRTARDIGSRNG
ncbi:MAG: flagellar hook-basal body protein [Polyangiales bacterium]